MITQGMIDVLLNYKEGCTVTELAKKTDITYSHVHKILTKLIDAGLIKAKKKGRKLILYGMTPKCIQTLDSLFYLDKRLKK